jgi:hypothetical protein
VIDRFRVSPAEAAEFRAKLRPYRVTYDWPAPVCKHDVRPEEAPLVMHVTEIEISWSDATGHATHLIACDEPGFGGLNEAIRQALWSVHLYIDARRRD